MVTDQTPIGNIIIGGSMKLVSELMFLTEQLLRNITIWHYQLWKLACGINGKMTERLPNDEKRCNLMLITDTPHQTAGQNKCHV